MPCGKFPGFLIAIFTWSVVHYSTEAQPAESSKVCLIVPPDLEQCYRSFENKPISSRTAQVSCLQKLLWNFQPDTNLTADDTALVTQLMDRITGAGFEAGRTGSTISGLSGFANVLSPSGTRTRREYRTLSTVERTKFHDAMRILYETNVIRTYARIHAEAARRHHDGASFLPWHRVYLVMFEEELRKVDPDVFLPYWDSTIDDAMDNPVNSVLWSPPYFGNGVGDVITGFAAGWVSAQGNLERDYGRNPRSSLMKKSDISLVLTRCNLRDIAKPTARPDYDFESYHNAPHRWIGGDMGFASTTGYDPVFYMYHAYIDYVWELFRSRQRSGCGVDPASDYPSTRTGSSHSANATMTGFPDYTNWEGIQNYWIENWYSYANTPTCPNCCPNCDSSTMYCSSRLNVCVANSRRPSRGFGESASFFDASELAAIDQPPMPRNRGPPFAAPVRGDSRTLATAEQDAATAVVDPVSSTGSRSFPQTFDTRRSDSLTRSTVGRSRNVDLSSVTGFHPAPRFRGHPFSAPLRKK